jgi:hypothetical protein
VCNYGPINYIDNKAKCCHPVKGPGGRVYRLEIQSGLLVFSTQLYDLLPRCPSPLLSGLTFPLSPPSLCEQVYCIHIYSVQRRGVEVLGLRQINTCRKVSLQANFLDDIYMCLSCAQPNCLLKHIHITQCTTTSKCASRYR